MKCVMRNPPAFSTIDLKSAPRMGILKNGDVLTSFQKAFPVLCKRCAEPPASVAAEFKFMFICADHARCTRRAEVLVGRGDTKVIRLINAASEC